MDVVVIEAGPAGLFATLRAAELGARTVLVTRGEVGGMAANDGPIPVRVLAHAARLLRNAGQLGRYGISVSEPILDYPQLLARTREVVHDGREHAARREQLENVGVTIYDNSGTARFVDPHTIETGRGLELRADKIILSAGRPRQRQNPGLPRRGRPRCRDRPGGGDCYCRRPVGGQHGKNSTLVSPLCGHPRASSIACCPASLPGVPRPGCSCGEITGPRDGRILDFRLVQIRFSTS